ncbi:MAG: hypothetical protein KatS3mg082_0539 [Nitrospiraceae bacterium]|nr:MAG: hypothetical protein KatS3mg082_0539 [Nitrospiraceae bacterium]
MIADGFQLVRQGIDVRDGENRAGVEFVSDAQCMGLKTQPELLPIAVIPEDGVEDAKAFDVSEREGDVAEAFCLCANQADNPGLLTARADRFHPHGLAEQRAMRIWLLSKGSVSAMRMGEGFG